MRSADSPPSQAAAVVTLPPISSLLQSLDRCECPHAVCVAGIRDLEVPSERVCWCAAERTHTRRRESLRRVRARADVRRVPAAHRRPSSHQPSQPNVSTHAPPSFHPTASASLPFAPPFPNSTRTRSSESDSGASTRHLSSQPYKVAGNDGSHYASQTAGSGSQRSRAFLTTGEPLPESATATAASTTLPSGLVADHHGAYLAPRSPTSRQGSNLSLPSLHHRRSVSLTMQAPDDPLYRTSSDRDLDRTPTSALSAFHPSQASAPYSYLYHSTAHPYPGPWSDHHEHSSASRKRPAALYVPDGPVPRQTAPYGRPRAYSISSSDEYRTIPAEIGRAHV